MVIRLPYHLIAFCGVLLMACSGNPKPGHDQTILAGSNEISLKKLSPEEALAKFGKPLTTDSFDLFAPLSEFRIEIYNYVPEEERNSPNIKIKEYTWTYNSQDNITVWYRLNQGAWGFVHYSIWRKDAHL